MSAPTNAKKSVTVIITAHREGLVVWPSYRSVAAAVNLLRQAGHAAEVCAVLDRADVETTRLTEQALEFGLIDQIVTSTAGDVGLSRHVGLDATSSDLVAIVDADDLFSESWLLEATRTWERGDGRDIIHPEWRLFFGSHWSWQRLVPQEHPAWQLQQQAFVYDYSSAVLAHRQVWQQHPYEPSAVDTGFGYEDWHWGLELIAAGYRHTVAPGTVRFYRHQEGSLCRLHDRACALLRPTAFFNLPAFRKVSTNLGVPEVVVAPPTRWRQHLRRIRWQWREVWRVTFEPLSRRFRNRLRLNSSHPGRDSQLLEFWRQASAFEPLLSNPDIQPDRLTVAKIMYRSPQATQALPRLLNDWDQAAAQEGAKITHAIFVPFIMQSGADRIVAAYARAIKMLGGHPLFILTERSLIEPGILPPDIPVIDATHLNSLAYEDQWLIMSRLLVQQQPEHTLLVNAKTTLQALARHPKAIATYTKLWCLGFTDDLLPDQRAVSWLKLFLADFADQLTGILTDSNTYKLEIEKTFGLPSGLVSTVNTPIPTELEDHRRTAGPARVLWAGRLDRQKRPDRLVALARRLPDVSFEVWGRGYLDNTSAAERQLSDMPNIRLHGGYANFAQVLKNETYSAFVYTAQWDGLPLVILEAVAAGLPVVTTDSGGVTELIDNSCGWVVPQASGPASFATALRECLESESLAAEKATEARRRLIARHSLDHFFARLREVGLLSTTKQNPNGLE